MTTNDYKNNKKGQQETKEVRKENENIGQRYENRYNSLRL